MKYLFVSLEMNSTAPGIVFKTLLNGLSGDGCEIHVICPNIDSNFLSKDITTLPCPHYHFRWKQSQRAWKRHNHNPKDSRWVTETLLRNWLRIRREHYDAVISLASNGYFASLDLANRISRSFGLKWLIYSVDGLPCPAVWDEGDPIAHRHICSHMDKVCAPAGLFLSANEYMLEYQLSVIRSFHGKSGVVYTPWMPLPRPFAPREHQGFVILYAGSLYGLRKIDGLLEGFRKFRALRPDAKLRFVGDCPQYYKEECAQDIANGTVEFLPYSSDIQTHYENADILLDIAADIPDDVYLSSKVISYLPVPLPVVTISGANSPVRNLIRAASVFHCSNNGEEIFRALMSIGGSHNVDAGATPDVVLACRHDLLEKFSSSNQAAVIRKALTQF